MTTPPPPPPSAPPGALRRNGGGRVAFDRRAVIVRGAQSFDAWSMNVSRGGLRVIMEDEVSLGDDVVVIVGEPGEPDHFHKASRVVWVQPEVGGYIVGLEFKDHPSSASVPAAPIVGPADGEPNP